jgi:hypothetical protein
MNGFGVSFFAIHPIVPKRLGLSCGLHIRKHSLGSVKSRYNIVSGGFDKCSPHVEEHWPCSASA